MDSPIWLYLFGILSGFALLRVPLTGFLSPINPIVDVIGVLAVLLFSIVLIFKGVMHLIDSRRRR
ncbi:hypothetical protein AS034_18255 [[Bacillus] enclensis]|uniref:Uncharacterized protein n=1 Tax=[Bacillus] enclensis TaxID=1402860 RepID=A0A0V8HC00_9BACI|nr:hypothetical protein [[Bacillus] enclensis]OAT80622.1 hypothetical protein A6P54_14675 [Bacillus sp. MKU004]QTC40135.1 hypothetical protein I7V34_13125 [Bacillus sp. V3]QWC22251.1 hypothetical protein KJK41_18595 [Bacillus haikouensis]KSU59972.1 hypothetical protein AS034_18255 [[Bacillus] enclensis]SCC29373.1 hypothetical protein GA0061094_3779 [[Bacillus] enclensis]